MAERLNILITCAGRRVTLVELFRQALAQLGVAGQVLAADLDELAPARLAADGSISLPRVDAPDYLAQLQRVVTEREVGLVVPATDLDLVLLADQRDRLAALGCQVAVSSPQAVAVCRDKSATADAVRAAGLPTLRSVSLEAFQAGPFWPCFVKPLGGSGGVGAAKLETPGQLAAHVERFGEKLLVQEYAPGREYTLDVYRRRDGAVVAVVPRQRLSVRSGEVERGVTAYDRCLIEAGRRLVESIDGLWGVVCCQCRCAGPMGAEGESEPKFFEINPRFGGGTPLSVAAGVHLPRYLLEEVTGRAVSARLGRLVDGLAMSRCDREIYTPVEDRRGLGGFETPRFR